MVKDIEIKLHEIVKYLSDPSVYCSDNSLMYGNMGIALFLYKYYQWKENNSVYKKASSLMLKIFDDLNQRIHRHKLELSDEDLSFSRGLCGIGYGINYLIKAGLIDCDIQETMCLIDACIYRRMVRQMQNVEDADYRSSLEFARYAVSRDDRLSKEYLRRYVAEWLELKPVLLANEAVELLKILQKISEKYPDMENTDVLSDYYMQTIDLSSCSLRSLGYLVKYADEKEDIMDMLAKSAIHIMAEVPIMQIDCGLERGLISVAYQSAEIYKTSNIKVYSEIADKCIERLLKEVPLQAINSGRRFWATSSNGVWSIHCGLLNGLAGIGFTLLEVINIGTNFIKY